MKKLIYFDCYSGISGDMILGALVDAGLPFSVLKKTVLALVRKGITLRSRKVRRGNLIGTKVDVRISEPSRKRLNDLQSIVGLIRKSALSGKIKDQSCRIFERLAACEAKAHGFSREEVTFDELGGYDTLVDVVGAVAGLEYLKVDEIVSSPVNVGEGIIHLHHGRIPAPGPATGHLLKDVPVYSNGIKKELTTPTGAAILSTLAHSFGSLPLFRTESIGMGAGDFQIEESPNFLRVIIGWQDSSTVQDEIYKIETHIDDLNPQIYETVLERLFQKGALDVTLTPIIMKKGRPAILLTVLSAVTTLNSLSEAIFSETASLGLRIEKVQRRTLKRKEGIFESSLGPVRTKSSFMPNSVRISPEYEDCKAISRQIEIPLRDVLRQIESEILTDLSKKGRS